LLAALLAVTPARADETEIREATSDLEALRATRDESTATVGMAEFGTGLLLLPGASLCIDPNAGCRKGDSSLAFEGWPLFRRGHFAAGAGLMMGVTSGTGKPYTGSPDVPRSHFRRYLTLEGTARYYVPLGERVELYGGLVAGLVVVNDTFQAQNGLTDEAVVGPRGATLLTEGLSVGAGAGLTYTIAQHWRLGAQARFSFWFLPRTPARDPLEDQASLTGTVEAVEVGLTLAYRSRLVF
jgi:hypothetical protein